MCTTQQSVNIAYITLITTRSILYYQIAITLYCQLFSAVSWYGYVQHWFLLEASSHDCFIKKKLLYVYMHCKTMSVDWCTYTCQQALLLLQCGTCQDNWKGRKHRQQQFLLTLRVVYRVT